jgi:hypothetical protein
MTSRREFIKSSLYGAGAVSLGSQYLFADSKSAKPPTRFIFIHKGNGLFPKAMVPPSFDKSDIEKENKKETLDIELANHELPDWMSSLSEHKDRLTILQGLSGKMCTTGHHTWCSSLGVYKANERLSSIKWATVDFELARLFPSPLEHIELACFPSGGGNARGNINGIEKGFSARGPQQPNYAFGSPKIAMQELFKSVSANKDDQIKYQLERKVLSFMAGNQSELSQGLTGLEKAKVSNYAESIESIRERNKKIEGMAEVIRKYVPKLDEKYFADDISTLDRQKGHTEILLSSLISGMTNIVSFTMDELGTVYTGLPELENEKVGLHEIGHGKPVGRFKPEEVRDKLRTHHMQMIDVMVKRLQSVPEGDGNMFDNTMIFYFPDNGETHHSNGSEWPFIVLSGRNTKLNIAGRYIRLPYWGRDGHKTLGNFYTSVLNAYGNPINHFGDFDLSLRIEQSGAIQQFMS